MSASIDQRRPLGPYFFGRTGPQSPADSEQSPPARLADLDALPRGFKGEIIEGVLYTTKRPRASHQRVVTALGRRISEPFDAGRRGPGGWWILVEPGIQLPGTPELAPDLAGWRRDRVHELPPDGYMRTVPDWVCEVLSPSTRRYDLLVKKAYYARIGVPHLWLADRAASTLTAYQLEGKYWVDLGTCADEPAARIPPFEAVEVELKGAWG